MFVSEKRYRRLEAQLARANGELYRLAVKWGDLVDKINAKGGQAFLDGETGAQQFTQDEIKTLIQLCHPDKHGGKESAARMTQRLLELRDK